MDQLIGYLGMGLIALFALAFIAQSIILARGVVSRMVDEGYTKRFEAEAALAKPSPDKKGRSNDD
jgi:hypothetical protein